MRVVVTGIGVVSPFGVGRERFWQHVSRGCSGTRAISDFDASDFPCRVAAPVTDVTIGDLPAIDGDGGRDPEHRADPKRYSRAALVGVIAAREAWNDAGLKAVQELGKLGTATGEPDGPPAKKVTITSVTAAD